MRFHETRPMRARTLLIAVCLSALAGAGCGQGSGKNIHIDGVSGPNVNFVDGKLTLSVALTGLQIDYGIRIPIPKMPNSYLEVGPDFQTNGYLINIGIDPNDVKALAGNQANLLDPTALPGGRPLPGVAEGQLPGMAVQIPKWDDLVFYVGANLLGVFVPVKLPLPNYIATFRFYDGTGAAIGNISVVGTDAANKNSGFLLLINLRGKVGKLIGMN